jgi:hypothetical protein
MYVEIYLGTIPTFSWRNWGKKKEKLSQKIHLTLWHKMK